MEPSNPAFSYELSPNGAVFEHQDIGRVPDYALEGGHNVWKAIVTKVRRGMEPGSPYLFSIVSGLANTHTQLATAIKWPTPEPSHILSELSVDKVWLRLEADEVNYKVTQSAELVAQIAYSKGLPNLNALNIGASLIQAARKLPPAFGLPYDSFKIDTVVTSNLESGFWDFSNSTNFATWG
ncbi:MAG: hypothetical protein JWO47_98 [Candidatus Saccharibacteria bacterium]|nr:hypothetical protein [Candidatus Saccharibacteria bacterium]